MSAAAKVFAIPELLEAILLVLPRRETFISQRVHTSFRDAVTASSNIQKKLFPSNQVSTAAADPIGDAADTSLLEPREPMGQIHAHDYLYTSRTGRDIPILSLEEFIDVDGTLQRSLNFVITPDYTLERLKHVVDHNNPSFLKIHLFEDIRQLNLCVFGQIWKISAPIMSGTLRQMLRVVIEMVDAAAEHPHYSFDPDVEDTTTDWHEIFSQEVCDLLIDSPFLERDYSGFDVGWFGT